MVPTPPMTSSCIGLMEAIARDGILVRIGDVGVMRRSIAIRRSADEQTRWSRVDQTLAHYRGVRVNCRGRGLCRDSASLARVESCRVGVDLEAWRPETRHEICGEVVRDQPSRWSARKSDAIVTARAAKNAAKSLAVILAMSRSGRGTCGWRLWSSSPISTAIRQCVARVRSRPARDRIPSDLRMVAIRSRSMSGIEDGEDHGVLGRGSGRSSSRG